MCTTAELVKISRGANGGLPALISGPVPQMTGPPFRPLPFGGPLQLISAQPGGPFGPAIIPRLPAPSHRLPIRTLSPMGLSQPTIIAQPPPPLPSVQSAPYHQKPKFQVQANAVNVPDSVRKSMAPPPTLADEPEQFKVPTLEHQQQQLDKKKAAGLMPSRHTKFRPEVTDQPETIKKTQKLSFNGESCLPYDLLDDQDDDDQTAVVTHHPPSELLGCSNYLSDESDDDESVKTTAADAVEIDKINNAEIQFRETACEVEGQGQLQPGLDLFPAPIGHGRRHRGRNSQTEDIPDFDFLNSMSNDWSNMTKKLTSEQISPSVWGPATSALPAVVVSPAEMVENESQTEEWPISAGDAKIIIPTGRYQYAPLSDSNPPKWTGQKTIDSSIQVMPDEIEPARVASDPYADALGDLCELFPNFSPDELEYFLTTCNGDLSDAIDLVIESNDNDVSVAQFTLDQTVLEAYNCSDDDLTPTYDQSSVQSVQSAPEKPVTIQDSKLFQQLIDRFGPPNGVTATDVTEGTFAAIPLALAKEIYDWWTISIMDPKNTAFLQDRKMAKELNDAELAHQMQREWNDPTPIRKPTRKPSQEFPPLSEDCRVQSPAQGDWTGKNAFSDQIKMTKLMQLFPHLPKHRLDEILKDNLGSMEDTIKTLCHLLDKDPAEMEKIRIKNSRTAAQTASNAQTSANGNAFSLIGHTSLESNALGPHLKNYLFDLFMI